MRKLLIFIFLNLSFVIFAQNSYTVKTGDTIYSIAKQFNLSQDKLMELNKFTSPSDLKAGMKILVSDKSSNDNAIDLEKYIVEAGDTLYGIARKFNMQFSELLKINELDDNSLIKPGQNLLVKKGQATVEVKVVESVKKETVNKETEIRKNENKKTEIIKKENNIIKDNIAKTECFWPFEGIVEKVTGRLNGVKIIGKRGQDVKAISDGKIVWIAPHRGFGNVVLMETKQGYRYSYIGLGLVNVKLGDNINKGHVLGSLDTNYHENEPALFLVITDNQVNIVDPWKAPRS